MTTKRHSGFTLIELLVALAVAAILLGVGVPSFIDTVMNARMNAQYNQVARSLFIARSEAVKSSEFVVVCARSAPEARSCGTSEDWKNGWIVFVDVDSDAGDAAEVGAGDTIISLEPEVGGENTVTAFAREPGSANAEDVAHVRYLPRGNTAWDGASLVVCDAKRGSERSRVVNVRLTGDIQPGRPNGTETIPRDVFGDPIDCGSGT